MGYRKNGLIRRGERLILNTNSMSRVSINVIIKAISMLGTQIGSKACVNLFKKGKMEKTDKTTQLVFYKSEGAWQLDVSTRKENLRDKVAGTINL